MKKPGDDILLKAIDDYELYPRSQREVLKILIKVSTDDIASVGVPYLMDKLSLTRSAIYSILKNLQNEDIILKVRLKNTKQDSFKLNRKSLERLLQTYHKKQSVEENTKE